MDSISDGYRELNRVMHEARADYGLGGRWWATAVLTEAERINADTILDYGCGKGTLAQAIRSSEWEGKVYEFDPCVPGKDSSPVPADLVVLTDVLEHVEPEYLEKTIDHIKSLTIKELFVVVSVRPARKTLPDGRNAHLIVQDFKWWAKKLGRHFDVLRHDDNVRNAGEVFAILVPRD